MVRGLALKLPNFRLFRLTSPTKEGMTHAGEAWIKPRCQNCGAHAEQGTYLISAKVLETQFGPVFQGNIETAGDAQKRKSRAKKGNSHDAVTVPILSSPLDT